MVIVKDKLEEIKMPKQVRRAGQDESIQAQAPNEEISLTERPLVNLGSTIDAEMQRPGLWFDARALQDLADVSSDIHRTRRHSNYYDQREAIDEISTNRDVYRDRLEKNIQYYQKQQLLKDKLKLTTDFDTALQDAEDRGLPAAQELDRVSKSWDKRIQDMYNVSPYMADSLESFRQERLLSYQVQGINQDYARNRAISANNMQNAFNALGLYIVSGTRTMEEVMSQVPSLTFESLDGISDQDDRKVMQAGYNTLLTYELAKIESQVKSGLLSPANAQKQMLALANTWKNYTFKGKDSTGADREIKVTMDPQILNTALDGITKAPKLENTATTLYTAEEYIKMTNDPLYMKSATSKTAFDDFARSFDILAMEASRGNKNAVTQMYKITDQYYHNVAGKVGALDIVTRARIDTKNGSAGITKINNIVSTLGQALTLPENQRSAAFKQLENSGFLTWTDDTGTITMNFAFPEEQYMLQRPGTDIQAVKFNYYSSMYNTLKEEANAFNKDPDRLAYLDPTYSNARDSFWETISVANTIRVNDKGDYAFRVDLVPEAVQKLMAMKQAEENAVGNNTHKATSKEFIQKLAKDLENTPIGIRSSYLSGLSMIYKQAGMTDALTLYRMPELTKEEQQVALELGTYAMLRDAQNGNQYINAILTNKIGGAYPNPTRSEAETILKGQGLLENGKEETYIDDLEAIFNKHNVSPEFRPLLRYMAINLGVAMTSGSTKGDRRKFDLNIIDSIVSEQFSTNGTYKHYDNLRGLDPDQIDAAANSAVEDIHNLRRNYGMNDIELTYRINGEAGRIEFYADGQPYMATGTAPGLEGTNVVPFGIEIGNKPEGMPQGKYDRSIQIQIAGATGINALTGIDTNTRLQRYRDKVAPGYTNQQIKDNAYVIQQAIIDPEAQRQYLQYRNSNYQSTDIVRAPDAIKKIIMEANAAQGIDIRSTAPVQAATGVMNAAISGAGQLLGLNEQQIQGIQESVDKVNPLNPILNAVDTAGSLIAGTPLTGERQTNIMTQDELSHYIDFMYTYSSSKNKAKLDVPKSTNIESTGYPYYTISEVLSNTKHGYYITSTTGGTHTTNSMHYRELATDIGLRNGFWEAIGNNGKLKVDYLDDIFENFFKPLAEAGIIRDVGMSFPELLSNNKDAAYFKYSKYINPTTGKPLFTWYDAHNDHYHVNYTRPVTDKSDRRGASKKEPTNFRPLENVRYTSSAAKTLYDNVNSIPGVLVNMSEAKSCAIMGFNYKPTEADAKAIGASVDELSSTGLMRSQAYAVMYGKLKSITGSADAAIVLLSGGKVRIMKQGPDTLTSWLKKVGIDTDWSTVRRLPTNFDQDLPQAVQNITDKLPKGIKELGSIFNWPIEKGSTRTPSSERSFNEKSISYIEFDKNRVLELGAKGISGGDRQGTFKFILDDKEKKKYESQINGFVRAGR